MELITWLVKSVAVWNRLFVSFDAHRLQVKFHNGQAAAEQDLNNGKIQKIITESIWILGLSCSKTVPISYKNSKQRGYHSPAVALFLMPARIPILVLDKPYPMRS